MTNSDAPETSDTSTQSSFNMWKGIVVAMLLTSAVYYLARVYADNQPEFKVTTQRGFPGAEYHDRNLLFLNIQSVNEKALTVRKVVVNNSSECFSLNRGEPVVLSTGEMAKGLLICDPVKVEIVTDQGNATYTFRD